LQGVQQYEIPDLCAYPLDLAQQRLRHLAPHASVRIVRTSPPKGPRSQGRLRVLRQQVLADGMLELLVAAEDGGGPVELDADTKAIH